MLGGTLLIVFFSIDFFTKYGNINSISHSDKISADNEYWNKFVSQWILSFCMKI